MFFTLTVKLLINMHDLNNERSEEIRRVPIIYQKPDGSYQIVDEAVAVSGVMLKHWHLRYMVEIDRRRDERYCWFCKRGIGVRVPPPEALEYYCSKKMLDKEEANILSNGKESDLIKHCAGEDIHGFLRTKREETLRREALIKFSWLLPMLIEEALEKLGTPSPFRILQHSRNIPEIPSSAPADLRRMQMPYPRAYSDGIFGFVSTLNLDKVGFSFTENKRAIDDSEIKERRKLAILAYVPMITGAFGASQARALPVSKVLEVMAIVSRDGKALPSPVHPIYHNYDEQNVNLYSTIPKLFDADIKIFTYNTNVSEVENGKFAITKVKTPIDAFNEAIEYLGLK